MRTFGLLLAVSSAGAGATRVPQARLVHCGEGTCLQLSGHRPQPSVAVRVAGQALAVEGGRAWRVTVPLATARGWVTGPDYSLTLTLADPRGGARSTEAVLLPPGALGAPVQLATLVVRAR